MVTQTWTYQPKNTEERIGKEVQVRNEYIGVEIDDRILQVIGSKDRSHVGGRRHEVRAEREVIQIY
jgi:hypothetical protein